MSYANSDQDKIAQAKQTIATVLANDHHGKNNSISSKRLGEAVGLKPTTVRDIIPEIRREYLLPVISGSKGYYVCNSQDEFVEVLERINDTIETKERRRQELVRAWNGES